MRGEAYCEPESKLTQQEHYDLVMDFLKNAAKNLAITAGLLADARRELAQLDYPGGD